MHSGNVSSAVAFAAVVDHNMWTAAAVLVQQLVQLRTSHPIVVFNVTALPAPAVLLLEQLGAIVSALEPSMPVPPEFASPLLSRPFVTRSGVRVLARYSPWAKLAIWGQTQWAKLVLLDVDVVLLSNVDEMASFPPNTFSPETCNSVAPARCDPARNHVTGGFNAGVLVAGPSPATFASMGAFASERIGGLIRRCANSSEAREVERWYLAYPEQSFIKKFWPARMHGAVEGAGRLRAGYQWQWRTAPSESAAAPPTSFMSRVYNARPFDCSTCSADYVAAVKIVHFTCSVKPWGRTHVGWQRCAAGGCGGVEPCLANWTLRWHEARERACKRARQVEGAAEAMKCDGEREAAAPGRNHRRTRRSVERSRRRA